MNNVKPNDGGPAFPVSFTDFRDIAASPGMSLRAYFAGQAMQVMMAAALNKDTSIAITETAKNEGDDMAIFIARAALQQADALISELNKPTP